MQFLFTLIFSNDKISQRGGTLELGPTGLYHMSGCTFNPQNPLQSVKSLLFSKKNTPEQGPNLNNFSYVAVIDISKNQSLAISKLLFKDQIFSHVNYLVFTMKTTRREGRLLQDSL